MARERGLYRRQDSPFWWIRVVLPDGRRVCKSTRLREFHEAEEYLVRLKAEAYEVVRSGLLAGRTWQAAVVRYLTEISDKRTAGMDRLHLRQLDPFLRGTWLHEINMDVLRSFIQALPMESISGGALRTTSSRCGPWI